ncbi:MAG: CRISPR-associated ring nuclease Csm6 [Armatimonadota bacterium]|nr:CRISPR-associated ring nuclease Csm6 [Armatimonadota bacterium]MDR7528732.1 CRISPR-associated ring nuclease Csm6 [Armatimonadota bacterium]
MAGLARRRLLRGRSARGRIRRPHRRPATPGRYAPAPVAICLAGLSPAVVTETLYALAVASPRPVVPSEVHVLTTQRGYPRVVATLLGPDGALARLRAEYRLPPDSLRCTPAHVHVLAGPDGRPLDDIRTAEESRAAGEGIAALVRRLAADDGVRLHCSLAGGRKTMSVLLATALQLHGRPGDRLYHVLVSEPFEQIPEFLYPPRRPTRYRWAGRMVDARRARVELVEVPFVPLGAAARLLGYSHLALERIAAELEAEARGRLVPEPLALDPARHRARVGDRSIALPPQEAALYAFYATLRARCRAQACQGGGRCPSCHPTDDEIHDRRPELAALYGAAQPRGEGNRVAALLWAAKHDARELEEFRAWLQQTRSRLNRRLRDVLGAGPRGRHYLVAAMGNETAEGRRRRGLGLSPRFVRVEG